MDDRARFEGLLKAVVESSEAGWRKARDRAANRARAIVADAEDRLAELEGAAKEIGTVRGGATEAAYERDADDGIAEVLAGAFERLLERFRQRVRHALESLPDDDARYDEALRAWARQALAATSGPTEVFAAPRDRERLYDALLAAGAEDFRVLTERKTRSGFVVRDLDGRTVFDCRPDALVARERDALERILRDAVPDPEGPRTA